MKHHQMPRRDFIKLLGMAGLFIPASKLRDFTGRQENAFSRKKNFLILLFDSLSARHMSLYGYARKTTPNIEKFAETSTTFHQHHAVCNFTASSTASLLTGVLPWSHRALSYYTSLLKFYEAANIFGEMAPDFYRQTYTHNMFVAAILQQFAGQIDLLKPMEDLTIYNPNKLPDIFKRDYTMGFYATKKWSDNYMGPSNSLFLNPVFSIAQLLSSSKILEANEGSYPLGLSDNQEGYLFKLEDAIDWIGNNASHPSQPSFGYFHLLPPHEAYRPRADFIGTFAGDGVHLMEKPKHFFSQGYTQKQLEEYCELYDDYIAFVDAEFGRLYGMLQKNGALDDTYLILTSDHGQLFERGIHGHGITLYEPVIHIPLLIHAPGQIQREDIHTPTSNIDIVPTILQLTGQHVPGWLEGKVLPATGKAAETERILFSMDGKENPKMRPITKATFAAIRWPYKFINYRGYPKYDDIDELFNLDNDPEELNNLASTNPSVVADLKTELRSSQMRAEKKSIGNSINNY